MMEHVKPRGVITRQSMNEYRLCLCDHGIKFAWWQHPAMGQRARLHATLLTIVLCQWSRVHNWTWLTGTCRPRHVTTLTLYTWSVTMDTGSKVISRWPTWPPSVRPMEIGQ